MFFYYTIFFLITLISFTKHRVAQVTTIIIFIFIVGLRYEIGGDWYTYIIMYDEISRTSLLGSLFYTDPAYGLINYLSFLWGKDIWLVNLICAIIFFIGIDIICRYCHKYWLAFIIAFPYIIITVAMGYTRQSVAIGLALVAFTRLLKRHKFSYLFWLLIACLFHKSAILLFIFIPYAFNYNFSTIKNALYFGSFTIALFYVMKYLNSQENLYFNEEVSSSGAIFRMIIHFPAIIIYLFYRSKFKSILEQNVVVIDTLLALIIMFFFIAFPYSTFADRFNLYFYIFDILILSTFPIFLKRPSYYLYTLVIITLQLIIFSVWLNYSPFAKCCWIPYQNYLF